VSIKEPLESDHNPMVAVTALSIGAGRLSSNVGKRRRQAGRMADKGAEPTGPV
jgi:hypothetical protein